MINLLGKDTEKAIASIPSFADVKMHLYGKEQVKPKRKMGHCTVLAESVEKAVERADNLALQAHTEGQL